MEFVTFIDADEESSICVIGKPQVLPKGYQYITIAGVMYQCVSDPEFYYTDSIYHARINVRKMG